MEATLGAVRALLASGEPFSHVALASGACLPLRPLAEFDAALGADPEADFIEAVSLAARDWPAGGLSAERVTLFHPFPWKRRRRLFDLSVALQRRIGLRRRKPAGLDFAFGSQWWALSRGTLERMLADPQLPELIRYFRATWIPDESFFQSLARRHARRIAGPSPTLARFDGRGRPFVFHDDHADLLDAADHFFVRKIHPEAGALRARLLARAGAPARRAGFEGRAPDGAFRLARAAAARGREGLVSPARLKRLEWWERRPSPAPYLAVCGAGEAVADRLSAALTGPGFAMHGRLAGPEGPRFAGGASLAAGGVPATAAARDLFADQYIAALARGAAAAGEGTGFCLSADDLRPFGEIVAADPGARVAWIAEGWALDLPEAPRAAELAARERAFLAAIRRGGAALTLLPAARLLDDPAGALGVLAAEGRCDAPAAAPDFRPAGPSPLAAWRAAGLRLDPALEAALG